MKNTMEEIQVTAEQNTTAVDITKQNRSFFGLHPNDEHLPVIRCSHMEDSDKPLILCKVKWVLLKGGCLLCKSFSRELSSCVLRGWLPGTRRGGLTMTAGPRGTGAPRGRGVFNEGVRGEEERAKNNMQTRGPARRQKDTVRARRAATRPPQGATGLTSYLADVLEVLDVHPLGVHDLLDDVGPHLALALGVRVAAPAGVLLLLVLGAAGILRQLFLVDTQLQPTHKQRVTWGDMAPEPGSRPHTPFS